MYRHDDLKVVPFLVPPDKLLPDLIGQRGRYGVFGVEALDKVGILPPGILAEGSLGNDHLLIFLIP